MSCKVRKEGLGLEGTLCKTAVLERLPNWQLDPDWAWRLALLEVRGGNTGERQV